MSSSSSSPIASTSPFNKLDQELKHLLPSFKICFVCHDRPSNINGITVSLCTGCRCVYYCSRECQAKHWKFGHKSVCTTLKEVKTATNKLQSEKESVLQGLREKYPELQQTEEEEESRCLYDHVLSKVFPVQKLVRMKGKVRCAYKDLVVSQYRYQQQQEHQQVQGTNVSVGYTLLSKQAAIGQCLYECLLVTVVGLDEHDMTDEHDGFHCFQCIPDLLTRLGQYQLSFDIIAYYMKMFHVFSKPRLEMMLNSPEFDLSNKPPPKTPPYEACYCSIYSKRTRPIRYAETEYHEHYGHDPSSSFIVRDLVPLLNDGMIPMYHILPLAKIKIRLLHHLDNLDAFYTFLNCCNTSQCDMTNGLSSDSALYKVAGNRDIYYSIRSFVFDVKQYFPSTRFFFRNKKEIERQVKAIAMALKNKDKSVMDEMMQSERTPRMPHLFNDFMPTCFFHDPDSKEMIKNIYRKL